MAPLDGIRVLALEVYYAGNIGSLFLSRFGAEVIKLEPPETGDVFRSVGPGKTSDGKFRRASELRGMTGKKSISINLRKPEGLEAFWRILPSVDVVWTNMKPSSLLGLGISFDSLKTHNPNIIYSTLSGFGHDDLISSGPFGNWAAFDLIAQGLAGLQYRAEGEDGKPGYNGLALGDFVTAMMLVNGTVMALLRRQREGGGAQRVDVAMHDAMISLNELPLTLTDFTGAPPPRGRSGTSAPYGAYPTKDGFVNIAVGGTPVWRRFCEAIDRPELADDPRYKDSPGRVKHFIELEVIVSEWSGSRTSMEVAEWLHKFGVPAAPVYDMPEVLKSPQVVARNMLVSVNDPILGPQNIVGNPIKMSDIEGGDPGVPPVLGEHTREVLKEFGAYDDAEITELAQAGAIHLPAQGG
ncbi:Formyl-CoA transferase [Hyphomicrobiales bacterium]|nr:Formyl-CoA transferase [Hyphomicrobiales bacterium]CAH1692138.1 Formyl-CoA transferase [Hyphomicrobiales bacterium]